MDFSILIPEKYGFYLGRFTKSEYPAAFNNYCNMAASCFDALESSAVDANSAAARIMERTADMLPRRFGRKTALFDIKRVILLFTLPAALNRDTQPCADFARAVQESWNALYPNDKMNIASFADIYNGFKDTIFGFEMGGLS